jgi:mannose-1-phosphate guanylyltransferase
LRQWLRINKDDRVETKNIVPVVLAGGAGTRLWPLSREEKPKQFHNLSGEGTLLEQTIKRLIPLNPQICLIVTAGRYEKDSRAELSKAGIQGIILAEPRPRNTAPAILYAATYLSKLYDDSIMIVLPADHYIRKNEEFLDVLRAAIEQASLNKLVTIGLKPTYPETGYGYIKAIEGNGRALPVDMFVEKPNLETAKKYILEGNYFWNSGIFVWKTSTILENFKKLMPSYLNAFEPLRKMAPGEIESSDADSMAVKDRIFSLVDPVSIDYGIMEKAEERMVIPGNFGWGDLGSWNSIDDILSSDENMNRSPERDRVIFIDSKNCSVFTESRNIALVGLSNIVVVESGSDILIMDKNSSQKVRQVVEIVRKKESQK